VLKDFVGLFGGASGEGDRIGVVRVRCEMGDSFGLENTNETKELCKRIGFDSS